MPDTKEQLDHDKDTRHATVDEQYCVRYRPASLLRLS